MRTIPAQAARYTLRRMSASAERPGKNILLLPGLPHARQELAQRVGYSAVAANWQALGHRVQVHQFGWYRDGLSFENAMDQLSSAVRQSEHPLDVVGISAGGLAAINALGRCAGAVASTVVVASPVNIPPEAQRPFWQQEDIPELMREAYEAAATVLEDAQAISAAITSLYGQQDERILPEWSRRAGIQSDRIPGHSHRTVILGALTVHRDRVFEALA